MDYKKLFAAVVAGWTYEHGDRIEDVIASVETATQRELSRDEAQAIRNAYAAHISGGDF